jgi:tetratricopeptide (TPR) repeat protein
MSRSLAGCKKLRVVRTMTKGQTDRSLSALLKWVGYLTAIFSLCATVLGAAKYLYAHHEIAKNTNALLATEAEEKKAGDYNASWRTLEKATQLDLNSARVRMAQDELAMAWLEDVHLQEGQKFSDVTDKVEPVLLRAVASSKPGPEQADLRAHVGWAYFLESRDGRADLDPAKVYREAVAEDGTNPYAQAMWGHWILWQSCGQISEAKQHFTAALAAPRERDYVRRLELSALLNCHTKESDLEVIRVANDMRTEGRRLDVGERGHILDIYSQEFTPKTAETLLFVNAVPPAEHVATFRWLIDDLNSGENGRASRLYYLAELQEAAGQREEALSNYTMAVRQMSSFSTLKQAADAGVKRLSHPH